MENNENFVAEQVTENVVQPTEAAVTEPAQKMFTQEDMNSAVSKAKARAREKAERDTRKQYEALEAVLRAGTGKTNATTEELINDFSDFYKKQGVKLPTEPVYSEKDLKILAKHEAEEIIRSGMDEVVEEVDRLAALGADKMSAKEKEMFRTLATHRQKHERNHEFGKMGISEDVYNSDDFQKFVGMFDPKTPVKQICEVYQKTIPKKNIKPAGSMVTEEPTDNGVKDFYTFEEARKFTKKDFDNNPALYKRVQESMRKW
jgi:hypothetical protein